MDMAVTRPVGERWYISFFFSKMAGGASAPLVPLFVITVLGGGVGAVTLAVVSVSVATVPAFILWGEWTDRNSKRRLPLVLGMAMTAAAFVVMGLSDGLPLFILGNVLYGFFLAATVPTSTVLIMEHNPEPEWGRAVGAFTKVSGMGWMLGMVMGVVWFAVVPSSLPVEVSMRTFMLACGVLSAVAYALAMAWIEEPRAHYDRRWLVDELARMRTWTFERARYIPTRIVFTTRPRIIRKARMFLPGWGRDLDLYLGATFVLFTGVQVFYVPFPVMLSEELSLGSSQIFLVYLASALMAALMYAWAGREVDQLGNRKAQLLAWGVRAVVFPSFAVTLLLASWGHGWAAFAMVLALNGVTGAFFSIVSVAGVTTALDLSPRRGKGEAVGAYNSVLGLGMIAGGFLGGLIASTSGYFAVVVTTGVLSAVAIALLLRVRFPTIG
jgi:MFS family permease